MNKEKIEYKMYIKDLNTNQESEEIDLYDFILNDDEIEFEFGMYGTDEYSSLPYKDFKFYINDYGIKIYSPQLEKLQQENKQLKEIIDKATSETKRQLKRAITQEYTNLGKILEILKGE